MKISELNYLEFAGETSDIYGGQDGILNSDNDALLTSSQSNSQDLEQDAGNSLIGANANLSPQTNAALPTQALVDLL
ncbi:MAG: hypothetical protein BRC40_08655 [Cyanobacteria bacterium QH_8_48_120]|jgi:hypothetical protein|nr:MAG: hypothetical protein BRC34_09000 [Cyanobacteria bacterium QH_1_48_107]PSO73283.1 MAG: hypothetical protein BRC40_08655 [Cyanobacteria bacterium QH_8_48_120]